MVGICRMSHFDIYILKSYVRLKSVCMSSRSPMQNVIGPINISHFYQTFSFIYFFVDREVPANNKNPFTVILRDYMSSCWILAAGLLC